MKPQEYTRLLVALETPGKGIIIEGPSGIGKTTAVKNAIKEVKGSDDYIYLSARSNSDIECISAIEELKPFGTVIIDDFHRLPEEQQKKIADILKVLADEGDAENKLIVIGINQAGQRLIDFGFDLATRIEIIKFESNSNDKIRELIQLGETALNIDIACKDSIINAAHGSFYMAQELANTACMMAGLLETVSPKVSVNVRGKKVIQDVLNKLDPKFSPIVSKFATGPRFRKEGRAPYFHLLKWLGEAKGFHITLSQAMNQHPEQKPGVTQIISKGFLKSFIDSNDDLSSSFFMTGDLFIVQDPQLVFYLMYLDWENLRKQLGYLPFEKEKEYDFALSFAGENRNIAMALKCELEKNEIQVFYDEDSQGEILAENVEKYLAPIYSSKSRYIVCLLGEMYPKKIWTMFERKQYEGKLTSFEVIPVLIPPAQLDAFSSLYNTGRIDFDLKNELTSECNRIAKLLIEKLAAVRQKEE